MYQALYRKYRPSVFSDVCGQEHITSVLRSQTESGRVSHAYLFCGSRGTGKTTCAKILAKAVNCENPQNGEPCGVCEACRAIDAGSAPDVLEMDAASNNGVDYIRDLRDTVAYTPAMLKKRVYIIDEVHMLSPSAFNAFLKTLEEPPPRTLFLLLADSLTEMLPTIVSRCQVIQVGGVRKLDEPWRSQVLEMLSGIREKSVFLDTARAELLTAVLDEMMARAEKVVREERKDRPVEDDEDTLKALVGAKTKGWRNDLLLTIEQWMQDLVRMKVAPDTKDTTLNFPEFQKVLMARAGHYSLARLLENLTMLEQLTVHLERNISPAQVLPYWMDRFYF